MGKTSPLWQYLQIDIVNMSIILQSFTSDPIVQVCLIIFIILLGVVIFETFKSKSARPAVTGFMLALVLLFLLDAAKLPWFWLWFIMTLVVIFAVKGKIRSYGLIGLSLMSFLLPIPFLYMYCPPAMWILPTDGPITNPSCIYGFTTLNLSTIIIHMLTSVFLVVSAVLIYKFDNETTSAGVSKS
jgi:hypothetical protein